jgi:hypothetical protein
MYLPKKPAAQCDVSKIKIDDTFGNRGIFELMELGWSRHFPIAISPDFIWLLIIQSASIHITQNEKIYRDKFFVNFKKKIKLTLEFEGKPDWSQIPGMFAEEIQNKIKIPNFVDLLNQNFSTTTSTHQIMYKLITMFSIKSYFKYEVIVSLCGIKSVRLYGNAEDWKTLADSAKELATILNLKDWYGNMKLIFDEIIQTLDGNVNTLFWKVMYRVEHVPWESGMTTTALLNGWLKIFYLYQSDYTVNDYSGFQLEDLYNFYKQKYYAVPERFMMGIPISNREFLLPNSIMNIPFILKIKIPGRETQTFNATFSVGILGPTIIDGVAHPAYGWGIRSDTLLPYFHSGIIKAQCTDHNLRIEQIAKWTQSNNNTNVNMELDTFTIIMIIVIIFIIFIFIYIAYELWG